MSKSGQQPSSEDVGGQRGTTDHAEKKISKPAPKVPANTPGIGTTKR